MPFAENHPVRKTFRTLAERGLRQSNTPDPDLSGYLSDLLVDFISSDNLYRLRDKQGNRLEYVFELLEAAQLADRSDKRRVHKQIGDYVLFIMGLFPESLERPRRCAEARYFAEAGRGSYRVVSQIGWHEPGTVVFRKLVDKFDHCVLSLNWVREYTTDPFYQYMFRQFDIY